VTRSFQTSQRVLQPQFTTIRLKLGRIRGAKRWKEFSLAEKPDDFLSEQALQSFDEYVLRFEKLWENTRTTLIGIRKSRMSLVKTTLEIPDDLFRERKAPAAFRGIKLRDFVTEAISGHLARMKGADSRWSQRLPTLLLCCVSLRR
jgi:hypothetical protein